MEKDGVALDWMKRRIAVNDRATVRTSSGLACLPKLTAVGVGEQVRPPQSQAAVEEALRPRAQVDWLDKVTMLACPCPCALSALTPMVLVPQAEHPAVVRFIGRVGKKRGLYVGLELLDYSEGLPEAVRPQLSAGWGLLADLTWRLMLGRRWMACGTLSAPRAATRSSFDPSRCAPTARSLSLVLCSRR